MNNKNQNYLVGAIIAAGNGSRMRPLSMPKALLPAGGKPIINYQLACMEMVGIKHVHVVVGYLKEQIKNHLDYHYQGSLDLSFVIQEKPEGIAHAVLQLEENINSSFMVFLGDMYILVDRLTEIVQRAIVTPQDSYLFCKREFDINQIRKNFVVELNDDSDLVRQVVEKPENPLSNLKGCGLYIFTPEIFRAIRETPRSKLRNEYEITDAIQTLINRGNRVHCVDQVIKDVNVNSIQDLENLNEQMKSK